MGQKIHNRIKRWKELLLDFGKRNRLINFSEGKRNNVRITMPSFEKLWDIIIASEKEISFPYAKKIQIDEDGEEIYDTIIKGDVETNKPIGDLQKTLKSLRYRANTSIEEQGINTLFLTFGMLKWNEQDDSSQTLSSPIILVPVKLLIESIASPYHLILHDDEIVVNPTLIHKMENDFGLIFPEFDLTTEKPNEYLEKLQQKIDNYGWHIERSVHLTNLSFLKINMYKDLDKNEERINENHIIAALCGEQDLIQIPEGLNNFDHDKNTHPIDTFQVVDADSSQQDAILLSKKGASFVLQGPPGTGKSQTITNIIAEAIADGKKILFVSEKMAALQVVYNRLTKVGLSDFCLTLHNHKANKKEILNNLANSINIDKTRVRDEALTELDLLERKRNSLNEYQTELHTPTSGLHFSIFAVNGKLAKLEKIPDITFPITDANSVNNEGLNERIYLLNELSKTISKRSENYTDNIWHDSSIRILSNSLRHEIDSNISLALPILDKLSEQDTIITNKLGIKLSPSLNGNDELLSILSFLGKCPYIPVEWIENFDSDALKNDANKLQSKIEQIIQLKEELEQRHSINYFKIEAGKSKEYFISLMEQLLQLINEDDCDRIAINIVQENGQIITEKKQLYSFYEEAKVLSLKLGVSVPDTIGKMTAFVKLTNALVNFQKIRPTKKWFDKNELRNIKSGIENSKTLHNSLLELKNSILSQFDKELFSWEFYPTLLRFRGDYNSPFRTFKRQYHKDIKKLRAFSSNGDKISYKEALNLLNKLKNTSDLQTTVAARITKYEEDYGAYYADLNTQWDILYNDIESFENNISQLQSLTPKLRDLIIKGELPIKDINRFNTQNSLLNFETIFQHLSSLLKTSLSEDSQWKAIQESLEKYTSLSSKFISAYQHLMTMTITKCNYSSIISDLNLLISLQRLEKELEKEKNNICNEFKEYYNGFKTNWHELLEALTYTYELKKIIRLYEFPKSLVNLICKDKEFIKYCYEKSLELTNLKESLQKYVSWFASLFTNGEEFYNYNIIDLKNRMSLCKDNKHLLEEWVDFCSTREKCYKAGLKGYIEKIEDLNIDSNYIVDAYLKHFYLVWLDTVLPDFPKVLNFRGRIHNQDISEFCKLDKEQFKIAQARVRERAMSRIPDFNAINGARDEIAILKREMNKQRRIMPLRKLFKEIPNLATSLRPCFMMSPLSVSVFLEAQSYNFDLVIFDEASQVHTEDAIGAIMRGKQVIIVGDTKQLPPTSFFATSLNEEDYDIDSDEINDDNNADSYESILDEAVTVLPERGLKWHYRSRHEHLIAFSNIKIYNGQLITFPSSVESKPDNGVEYIYVNDGIYDRGRKKNNVNEAKKVADLVFEHFRKYPNRSLGVVAFSEAQQNAIDAAIRQKRLKDPGLDDFFFEEKEDPFFIKNLENVQGDERDTIIFSIGYAKDKNGIMYMNFGPLSREGGYRRLNVAITRAKYNVKLVGSIIPSDIDLERVNSEGVKMLRSYIEFAQRGISAIENEFSLSNSLAFDSPFEEAVYNFLQSKNYNVVTQVGCSGFRIDMAIRHPNERNKFAIGIECDGATYHSSRTARERDRLRQTILEDMGWTIYRIWSTDWIKDTKTEETKLLDAIEKSIETTIYGSDKYVHASSVDNDVISDDNPTLRIEEKVSPFPISDIRYGFELYKRASPLTYYDKEGNIRGDFEIALDIISLEQPIHFEELCRRITLFYNRQKATSYVRTQVQNIIQFYLKDFIVIDKDNFIKLIDFKDIRVRIPDPNDNYIRPITYICDEELSLAMKSIVQQSFGITRDDLFITIAREFGFKRIGDNIINSSFASM